MDSSSSSDEFFSCESQNESLKKETQLLFRPRLASWDLTDHSGVNMSDNNIEFQHRSLSSRPRLRSWDLQDFSTSQDGVFSNNDLPFIMKSEFQT